VTRNPRDERGPRAACEELVGGLYYESQPNVTVARDGQALAYVVSDAMNPGSGARESRTGSGGVTTTRRLPEGRGSKQTVVWGAQTWEMDEAAGIEGESIPQECPGRGSDGAEAIGSAGAGDYRGRGPNRLRKRGERTMRPRSGLIAEGDVVTVLYGPSTRPGDMMCWQYGL